MTTPQNNTLRGIGFMLIAVTVWSAMMILVKALSTEYTSFQILFIRTLFGLAILTPILWRNGFSTLKTRRLPLHMSRAVFAYFGMLGLFIGLGSIPIAEVVSLSFTQPIFIFLLAAILLGEKLNARRVIAILGGFAGVLILLRPGFTEVGFGATVVLGGAIAYAFSNVCIKKLMTTENVTSTTVWVNILMCPLAGIPAAFYWVTPTLPDLALLAGVGLTGTTGIWFISRAYATAEMSAVVPFDFLRLPIVAAAGWIWFGEITDIWTIAGAAVIFASTYALARSEARSRS
ncbi:MAG: DMT family transporter [Rhodospirillaceae bacterium]|nr:DMT family transporter [Rhodospirillaceae bacterium]